MRLEQAQGEKGLQAILKILEGLFVKIRDRVILAEAMFAGGEDRAKIPLGAVAYRHTVKVD